MSEQVIEREPANDLRYEIEIRRKDAWQVIVTRKSDRQIVCDARIRSRDLVGKLLELLWL